MRVQAADGSRTDAARIPPSAEKLEQLVWPTFACGVYVSRLDWQTPLGADQERSMIAPLVPVHRASGRHRLRPARLAPISLRRCSQRPTARARISVAASLGVSEG